jgi:eukaryotic-like serine/threonine-protein kinase
MLALVPAGALAQEGEGWPGLQGGAAHLGTVLGAPVPPPFAVRWTVAAPGRDGALSSVAVGPGMAVANGRSTVMGFDPSTGNVQWTHPRATGVLAPPAVALVAAEDGNSGSGDQGSGPDTGVVVTFEGTGADDSRVLGLSLATGEELWRLDLNQPVVAAPTVDGDVAYVCGRDRIVYAIEVDTGELRWKSAPFAHPIQASPAAEGATVFMVAEDPGSGETQLSALAAATGKPRWSFAPEGLAVGSTAPTVAGGRVYVGFGDFTVRALDAQTGAEVWAAPTRSGFSPASAPALSGSSLFVSDERGSLYRLDVRTGRRLWEFQFDAEQVASAPLVDGDVVLLGLQDGQVGAVEVSSGDLVSSVVLGDAPVGAFAPAGSLMLAPLIGPGGGVVALQHDPNGTLQRTESPTRLYLDRALLYFLVAFLILMVAITAIFRRVPGMRPPQGEQTAAIGPDDLGPSSPHQAEP